jgi:tellurite resistance protein
MDSLQLVSTFYVAMIQCNLPRWASKSINMHCHWLCHAQDIVRVIHEDLDNFDAVCMATALHALASQRASNAQYAALFERPELLQLMHVIGALP